MGNNYTIIIIIQINVLLYNDIIIRKCIVYHIFFGILILCIIIYNIIKILYKFSLFCGHTHITYSR